MGETSSASSAQSTSSEQTIGVTHPKKANKMRSVWQEFWKAFTAKKPTDEAHEEWG